MPTAKWNDRLKTYDIVAFPIQLVGRVVANRRRWQKEYVPLSSEFKYIKLKSKGDYAGVFDYIVASNEPITENNPGTPFFGFWNDGVK